MLIVEVRVGSLNELLRVLERIHGPIRVSICGGLR